MVGLFISRPRWSGYLFPDQDGRAIYFPTKMVGLCKVNRVRFEVFQVAVR
jgi:hypothetical protein